MTANAVGLLPRFWGLRHFEQI